MTDINVTFELPIPVPEDDERPLSGVRIEVRRDPSLPWTEQGFVDAPGTTYVLQDVGAGPWYIRGFTVDDQGTDTRSPLELDEPVVIPFNPPQGLVSISAELV